MIRVLAALTCVVLTGNFLAAGQLPASSESDRELARLKAMLAELIRARQQFRDALVEEYGNHKHRPGVPVREPTIGAVAAITISKGGYATVEHTISWAQYPHDKLDVRMVASDASIVVPDTLALDFEKHQFRFTYEIRARDQAGEYTVTLLPQAGKAVTVKVIVK